MKPLLAEIRHHPLLWLLGFVPVVFAAHALKPDAHTLLFVLSVLAIIPPATLTASLVTNSGRTAWFVGVLVLMVYLIFAMTLYLLPPTER